MDNFKNYITESKNTHMTHIEDKVIYGGVKGTREAILALRSLRDMLRGEHDGSVSVKWDGAPAIFAGIDPRDGNFFVAKKGIFNKNPKVYKSNAATIKGEKYVTFHPNTIVYALPAKSDGAKAVKSAKIGIVWHTTYKGNTFESMRASYGVDVSKLKSTRAVWSQDAMLRDLTNMTMSKKDTEIVNEYLSQAGFLFNKIAGSTLRQLESNKELARLVEQFNNTFVRQGQVIGDTNRHVTALIKWINNRYQKEIDKRKSDKGKAAQQKKLDEILNFFSTRNKMSLKYMFDLQKVIVLAKLKLINSLNKLSKVGTFVKTKNGYKVTGEEGYVAIDKIGGDAVKIVDRMEFSYNNFSKDILKGWDKPGRN